MYMELLLILSWLWIFLSCFISSDFGSVFLSDLEPLNLSGPCRTLLWASSFHCGSPWTSATCDCQEHGALQGPDRPSYSDPNENWNPKDRKKGLTPSSIRNFHLLFHRFPGCPTVLTHRPPPAAQTLPQAPALQTLIKVSGPTELKMVDFQSIAKEFNHLSSSLTSSLGFISCIYLLTVLILLQTSSELQFLITFSEHSNPCFSFPVASAFLIFYIS